MTTDFHVAALLCLTSAACGNTPRSQLEINDDGRVLTVVRALAPLERKSKDDAKLRIAAIELEAFRSAGDDTQTLTSGEIVELDTVDFSGPGDIAYDYELVHGSVALRTGWLIDGQATVEGIFGLGWTHENIEASMRGQRDEDSVNALGFVLGTRFGFAPSDDVALYGRLSVNPGLAKGFDKTVLRAFELGGNFQLGEVVFLELGWRWIDYERESDESLASDISIDLSGPLISVGVVF